MLRAAFSFFLFLFVALPVQAAPNIVFIFTDDQPPSTLAHMPKVQGLIRDQGATFTRAYYNDPLCCPSRATMLTGRYVQNTGVWDNEHSQFIAGGHDTRTIAVQLTAAGYRTGLVGKYLNDYPNPKPLSYVPPGWDFWRAVVGGRATKYLKHQLVDETGKVTTYGSTAADYVTDVNKRLAVDFIRTTPAGQPLFLWLSFVAPHSPFTPAARHAKLFGALKAPRGPAWNEEDVSDKPAWLRARAKMSSTVIANVDKRYRDQVRTLQAVDEAVAAVVDTLRTAGRLPDTYIIFSTDNGWLAGEHRIGGTKGLAYEESLRMILYIRGPGIAAGRQLGQLAANADLAPTILDLAGAEPLAGTDARSLAPLLRGQTPAAWRQSLGIAFRKQEWSWWPSWRGVRTDRYTYVEFEGGDRELYDNEADPAQLRSRHQEQPALTGQLASLTARLATCKAAGCRAIEDEPGP